jgi:uncharacterized protein
MNMIDAEFLELVRCPVTRSRLSRQGDWLVAEIGGLCYPIRDGIPVLMPEEAKLPEGINSLDEFKRRYPLVAG